MKLLLKALLFVVFMNGSMALCLEAAQYAFVSDFHLRYLEGSELGEMADVFEMVKNDNSLKAFQFMMAYLKGREDISHVIVNGDVFDGPTTQDLSWSDKIDLIKSLLIYMKTELGKTIHFNLGNHDEAWDFSGETPVVMPAFSEELVTQLKELESMGIFLIGANSREVFQYEINEDVFEISHSPFIKTKKIEQQLQRIPKVHRKGTLVTHPTVLKVTNQPYITQSQLEDGVVRVFSDNHTPLKDVKSRVYDTGKLTDDKVLPQEPYSFLVMDYNGVGQLMEIDIDTGRVTPLDVESLKCRYLF